MLLITGGILYVTDGLSGYLSSNRHFSHLLLQQPLQVKFQITRAAI
jgi:hypothetical protein